MQNEGMPTTTATTSTSMKISTLSTNIISQITSPTLKFTPTTSSYVPLPSVSIPSKGTNASILSTESAPLQNDSTHRTKNRNAKIKLNFTINIQDFQDKNIAPKDVSFELVNGNMDTKIGEPKKIKDENKGTHGGKNLHAHSICKVHYNDYFNRQICTRGGGAGLHTCRGTVLFYSLLY